MCAEGNPLQLLWGVVKEAKIGRTIGARAKPIPRRCRNSQRTAGRVLTFVPLEERVDILPSRTMAGWRIVSSVLPLRYFSTPSTISMVRPVLLLG